MTRTDPVSSSTGLTQRFGCLQVLGILIIVVVVTALITTWAVRAFLFPSGFEPMAKLFGGYCVGGG